MQIRTYAHRISRVKALLGGMNAHADKLGKWGITPDFIANMTLIFNQANEVEQQRKAIKAGAQQLTVKQEQLLNELEGKCGMVKKLVRFELPKEYWPEFGFRKGEYSIKETEETTYQESTD